MNLIKVSSTSRTAAFAGAIAGVVREHQWADVQAIGAGAVNQAVTRGGAILKVIFENDYLDEAHIIRLCETCSSCDQNCFHVLSPSPASARIRR